MLKKYSDKPVNLQRISEFTTISSKCPIKEKIILRKNIHLENNVWCCDERILILEHDADDVEILANFEAWWNFALDCGKAENKSSDEYCKSLEKVLFYIMKNIPLTEDIPEEIKDAIYYVVKESKQFTPDDLILLMNNGYRYIYSKGLL